MSTNKIVVSVSGGKDSTACALLALEQYPNREISFVFADTGNENGITLDYVQNYLPAKLGIKITTVKASFAAQIERKRKFILGKLSKSGDSAWLNKDRDQDALEEIARLMIPTGIPFLDLCMWKGRFPSRMAQFCTGELKVMPLAEYQAMFMLDGYRVESWQGVRRDESRSRANAKCWEVEANDYWIRRPIVNWAAQEVVDYVRSKGLKLNPLYSQGMNRVGCFPCVNACKQEIFEISSRYPEHIERISEWENAVSKVSKRGAATFFSSLGDFATPQDAFASGNIWQKVEWSKTSWGGKQYDMLKTELDNPACSSSYGLCE